MNTKLAFLALLSVLSVILSACITPEFKEYRFKVNPDGSGTGTITFVNLVSQYDSASGNAEADFKSLISDYLEGSEFEDKNPQYRVTGKRLYEENGKLMGELTFSFASIDSFGFFRQPRCECCPTVLYGRIFDENFASSNGRSWGDAPDQPLYIVWEKGTKEFYVKTSITPDLTKTEPLLALWQNWKSQDPGKDKDKD